MKVFAVGTLFIGVHNIQRHSRILTRIITNGEDISELLIIRIRKNILTYALLFDVGF